MSVVEPGGSGDVPVIDDGLYDAVITAVKDVTLDEPDRFGNQDKVEIQVSFSDADGEAHTLEPRVNRKWGEKATLFTIAMACGLDVSPYESFDTEDLLKRKVRVLIETPEEGKWPRVKTWSRVARSKASAPSQPATEASEPVDVPSVILPDGGCDFNQFWMVIKRHGMNREHVVAHVGGDIETLMAMDGPDAQNVLNELVAIANG